MCDPNSHIKPDRLKPIASTQVADSRACPIPSHLVPSLAPRAVLTLVLDLTLALVLARPPETLDDQRSLRCRRRRWVG